MKYLLITVSLFLVSIFSLSAQLADRLVPHFGYMQEYVALRTTPNDPAPSTAGFSMLNFGTYAVLAHKNDVVSVGVDVSGQIGLRVLGGRYVDFSSQTPIYLMGKIGAGATPYNDQPIGFGLGIGGATQYFNITTTASSRLTSFTLLPDAVAQIRLNTRFAKITGRVHTSLAPIAAKITSKTSSGVKVPVDGYVSVLGFGLMYEF